MKNTLESLQKILPGKDAVLNKGGIGSKTTRETDPAALSERIAGFGGAGWLLTTNGLKERFSGSEAFGDPGFIIRGELFDGNRTLQITQVERGWTVSEKWIDPEMDAVYETVRYCRHQGNGMAVYEVSYGSVDMSGHQELQPVDYRFAGWDGR